MTRLAVFAAIVLIASAAFLFADGQFAIVSPQWVTEHASDPDIIILDVRIDPHDYFIGHVPGAVNMADTTMRGPRDGLPAQYLPIKQQAELLQRAGVQNGKSVVLYSDGQNVLGATMVAYVLERIGHPNVMIVDGGWSAYRSKETPIQQYPVVKPGKLPLKESKGISVNLEQMKGIVGNSKYTIIDARPDKAYTGEIATWMRNGHIPGAINIDWHTLMDEKNAHKFKSVEEMQAVYDKSGVKKTDDIILYCGTSREASLEYAVMKHVLGYPNVRLYEGSWTEWCSHPELPMETGDPKITKSALVTP